MSHTPGPLTYTTPDGKQWEVVEIRRAKINEIFIDPTGLTVTCVEFESPFTRPIVRPIIPEWITPTDEHAKQRPVVEVRDNSNEKWRCAERKLLAVISGEYPFVTADVDNRSSLPWKLCRMRNPEYQGPQS